MTSLKMLSTAVFLVCIVGLESAHGVHDSRPSENAMTFRGRTGRRSERIRAMLVQRVHYSERLSLHHLPGTIVLNMVLL
jgi:hypothetical protein